MLNFCSNMLEMAATVGLQLKIMFSEIFVLDWLWNVLISIDSFLLLLFKNIFCVWKNEIFSIQGKV